MITVARTDKPKAHGVHCLFEKLILAYKNVHPLICTRVWIIKSRTATDRVPIQLLRLSYLAHDNILTCLSHYWFHYLCSCFTYRKWGTPLAYNFGIVERPIRGLIVDWIRASCNSFSWRAAFQGRARTGWSVGLPVQWLWRGDFREAALDKTAVETCLATRRHIACILRTPWLWLNWNVVKF